jgi:ribosomal protein S6
MKDLVYSIPIDTIEVLRERVENTATTIRNNRGMLERVKESFRRRLHYCIDNNGGHFEHFL